MNKISELILNTNEKPLVSICVVSYQHKNYIEKCLEGILKQQVNFPVEIIIHDDASTDGTVDIIQTYVKKHKGLIKTIFQTENQLSKGIKPMIEYVYPKTKGKYVALCDGDDYWTDSYKLKKQINILERSSDISLCFHNSSTLIDNRLQKRKIYYKSKIAKNGTIIKQGGSFVPTSSIVFRKHILENLPSWFFQVSTGDYFIVLINLYYGKIFFLNVEMSIYRFIQNQNSWSSDLFSKKNFNKRLTHHKHMMESYSSFDNWSKGKYHKEMDFMKRKSIKSILSDSYDDKFKQKEFNEWKSQLKWYDKTELLITKRFPLLLKITNKIKKEIRYHFG
jgi:glycosyltransferase involved in cell wall biosynthesis